LVFNCDEVEYPITKVHNTVLNECLAIYWHRKCSILKSLFYLSSVCDDMYHYAQF
jgi:hypothetical protein